MSFTKKDWKNKGDTGYEDSKFNADNMNDLENRIEIGLNSITAYGTNANGNYIKFDCGIMICYHPKVFSVSDYEQWGSFYRKKLQNPFVFPVAFINYPTVVTSIRNSTDSQLINIADGLVVSPTGIESLQLIRPTNSAGETLINYIAIGRWK